MLKRPGLNKAFKRVPNVLMRMLRVYTVFSVYRREAAWDVPGSAPASHVKTDPGL